MASHGSDPPKPKLGDRNPGTMLPAGESRRPIPTPQRMLDAYRRVLAEANECPARAQGFRFFWEDDRSSGWLDLHESGAHAVVGRHSACDAVLAGPMELSLRHLVVMTIRMADGLALRVLDLHTNVPFYGFDETPRNSVVAFGPMALRLADAVLGAIPLIEDPRSPGRIRADSSEPLVADFDEADELQRSRIADDSESGSNTAEEPAKLGVGVEFAGSVMDQAPGSGPDSGLVPSRPSRVTSLPPPAVLGEARRANAQKRSAEALRAEDRRRPAPAEGPVLGLLTLQREGRRVSMGLTARELELGVLVGRSERCIDAGLQRILDTSISRGHLLLLQQQGSVEAFDLCSTQGTYHGGKRIRRMELDADATPLQLSTTDPVMLSWKPQ